MKIQVCKCNGMCADSTISYDTHHFILDESEQCPVCGSTSWYEVALLDVPGIDGIREDLEIVITTLNTHTEPNVFALEKELLKAAISKLEGV
tara:strand:- start:349 stop:624 length:276 start_codon:yes stop_codon:yes gene_type:complete